MMTTFCGMDIGSRSIELVIMSGSKVVHQAALPTTHSPATQLTALLGDAPKCDAICVTGYGRRLAAQDLGCTAISEITAYAYGAKHLLESVRGIIDIGGQDTKIISLSPNSAVTRFEMNDRCAAGTGRFLEVMALSFQMPIEEFGSYALKGAPGITINSMCTVFAESEVTSLIARGAVPQDVAYAIHEAAAKRTLAMLKRVGAQPPVMFAGGVARNVCIVKMLAQGIGGELFVPEHPEYVGALGAAFIAAERWEKQEAGA
jgi:(R)-2-hydroxyacyl-CoA dehydratese activating ATPase